MSYWDVGRKDWVVRTGATEEYGLWVGASSSDLKAVGKISFS